MAACTTHIRQEVKGAEASLCLFDFLTLVKWKGKCEPMAGPRQQVGKGGKLCFQAERAECNNGNDRQQIPAAEAETYTRI